MGEKRRQGKVDCQTSCDGSWLWNQGIYPELCILCLNILGNSWISSVPPRWWTSYWPCALHFTSQLLCSTQVVNKWSQIPKTRPLVVQRYVARPYLINGDKIKRCCLRSAYWWPCFTQTRSLICASTCWWPVSTPSESTSMMMALSGSWDWNLQEIK